MAQGAHGFRYQSLDASKQEIRVLVYERLSTAETSDVKLSCTMKQISLNEQETESYCAISYTWGDERKRSNLTIDGVQASVPGNTFSAISKMVETHMTAKPAERVWLPETLQGPDRPCVLWIDAVCINQQDSAERDSQMLLMRQVYNKASSVLIWHGDDPDNLIVPAYRSLQSIFKQIGTDNRSDPVAGSFLKTDENGAQHLVTKSEALPNGLDWKALRWFYSQPWNFRLWTIQESALNKNTWLVCGTGVFGFDMVWLSAVHLARKRYHEQNPFGEIIGIDRMASRREFQIPVAQSRDRFLSMLNQCCYYEAKEQRDRVFGLMGLVEDEIRSIIKPSYSYSVEETYARATVACIVQSGHLSVLSLSSNLVATTSHSQPENDSLLPSWAVKCHWTWPGNPEMLPARVQTQRKLDDLRSDFSYLPEAAAKTGWRCLPLKGNILCTVKNVSKKCEARWIDADTDEENVFVEYLLGIREAIKLEHPGKSEGPWSLLLFLATCDLQEIKVFIGPADDGESTLARALEFAKFLWVALDVLERWRVEKALQAASNEKRPVRKRGMRGLLQSMKIAGSKGAKNGMAKTDQQAADHVDKLKRLVNYGLRNRRVFWSEEEGWVGRGMPDVQPGDVVCELIGGTVPLVLRRAGTDWKLIGDCSVANSDIWLIMMANMFHIPDNEPLPMRVFHLL